MGGLHGFVSWPRGMLTDSGGFQVCFSPAMEMHTGCMLLDDGSRVRISLKQEHVGEVRTQYGQRDFYGMHC